MVTQRGISLRIKALRRVTAPMQTSAEF